MSDDMISEMHADMTAAVRETGGESSGDIAAGIVARGWVKPYRVVAGESAYDDLVAMNPGHVVADDDLNLYRKQPDGTWVALRDTPGATRKLEPGDLAFDAPFLVVIQPKD